MVKDGIGHTVSLNQLTQSKEVPSSFATLIEHPFSLEFVTATGKRIKVGKCTLYSSTSIVFEKVKAGFFIYYRECSCQDTGFMDYFSFYGKENAWDSTLSIGRSNQSA